MDIRVEVRQTGTAPRPTAGTPVILEVRDVSLQDAPATVLASTETTVTEPTVTSPDDAGAPNADMLATAGAPNARPDDAASPTTAILATAILDVPDEALTGGRDIVVWVRVAASGQARTAVGDLITMQHCAVRADAAGTPMEVPVTRIG